MRARSSRPTEQLSPLTPAEIGIPNDQSSRFQRLAAIPEGTYEAAVEAHMETGEPISSASIARVTDALGDLPAEAREELVARGEAEIIAAAKRIKAAHNHRAEGTSENEWYTPMTYIAATDSR